MAIQIKDKVVLDLSDDSDLRNYFSQKKAGDSCDMEISGTLDEASDEQAVLSISSITVDSYEADKTDEPAKKKDVKFKMGETTVEEGEMY
tara:strand:+ start:578 stop:847 length:270 start_codon:yes stop_codon:yes gene_type:complete